MRLRWNIGLHTATVGLLVLFGLSVGAQEAGHPSGNACREDMERLCAEVQPGGGAKIRCLKSHEDQLSDACRAQMAAHAQQGHGHGGKVLQACGDDAKRLCTGLEPGSVGILRCLRQHEADLSSACRAAMGPPRE
ncbi:MAG TPA: cysteine rich repeat-containing protein [Myxococcota bacterium]|nr:cysteine rich repeat-containing protein [Myxococcota bacterium]